MDDFRLAGLANRKGHARLAGRVGGDWTDGRRNRVDEPSIRLNLTEDLALLREFHGESAELLQNIEQGVLVLEEILLMRHYIKLINFNQVNWSLLIVKSKFYIF